ncbi:hypothetical protein C3L33_09113, partial [Rhododendron williamsianum]
MFFLIILMFLSLQSTHILVVDGSLIAAEYFNGEKREIEKVPGGDEREEKEALILEKFRFLLGLRSFLTETPITGENEAPAPSPTIEEAPAPLQLQCTQSKSIPAVRFTGRIRSRSRARLERKRAIARADSRGLKVRRERKISSTNTVSVYGNERGSGNGNGSMKKVSSDPGLDPFYLDSIGAALEPPQAFPFKQNPETVKISLSNGNASSSKDEREGSEKGTVRSEPGDSCSAAGEIVSVHDSGELVKTYDPDECEKIEIEADSSDDESFHSPCGSLSSNLRLSNASAGSLLDITEINQTPKREFPPNPPKPFAGIPPPPCPPPFSKGNGNDSLKTPPPAPSQQFHFMPLGKDGAPLPKLKPLHWDKVRASPDQSMVWDKLRSSSFEFDEAMIESLFGYNMQSSMKNDEAKSKSPPPSKHVLDPKRLQNITILSKALNATAEQVCDALLQGEGLCLQQLEALVKMAPTKEEEAKLSSYKGDIKDLGSTEKFLKAMLNIPFAFLRFEAMLYRETFEDEVVHLRKSFSMLEEACKELRSSRFFLKLLEAVLKTGNRMNIGTIRGGARAFKLDALLKLADVKGADGRTTLLHFVVQEIVRSEGIRVSESIMGKINQKNKTRNSEEREEDYRRMGLDLVAGLSFELCNVKKTATIDLDVLAAQSQIYPMECLSCNN